jgi:hypothetical protein
VAFTCKQTPLPFILNSNRHYHSITITMARLLITHSLTCNTITSLCNQQSTIEKSTGEPEEKKRSHGQERKAVHSQAVPSRAIVAVKKPASPTNRAPPWLLRKRKKENYPADHAFNPKP